MAAGKKEALATSKANATSVSALEGQSESGVNLTSRDSAGKVYEKILLTRILCEVRKRGILRIEQFRFRPKHSTAVQLNHLLE